MSEVGNALNNAAGSYILLSSQNVASQVTVSFSNFSSTYDTYFFVFSHIVTLALNSFSFQFSTVLTGGLVLTNYVSNDTTLSNTTLGFNNSNTQVVLDTSNSSFSGFLYCYNINSATNVLFTGLGVDSNAGTPSMHFVYSQNTTNYGSPTTINGMTFFEGSGTGFISGNIALYGVMGT